MSPVSDLKALQVRVAGRVQGVGYRYATRDQATRLGLTGWVRNLPSGQVEVFIQGAAAVVDRLVDWLGDGPRLASVTGVEAVLVEPDESLTTFRVRF